MTSPEVVQLIEDSKKEILRLSEDSFPTLSGVKEISLVVTAVSHVVLVSAKEGGLVYKLRRRVKIGDLCDFRVLEDRRLDCINELEKNQALAPSIYLDVVPVVLTDHTLVFGEEGKIVDWAVRMRRFREEDKMENRLKVGRVNEKHIIALAEKIAQFHQKLPIPKKAEEYGSVGNIKRIWDENFEQARSLVGTGAIAEETILTTEERITKFWEGNGSLFAKRVKEGKALNCHGDFHTGNVVIEEIGEKRGEVEPFDALEFNEAYSVHDVASEVAFMAMDLEFLGFAEFAELFVEKYVELTRDKEMVETGLLDFYKAHRAWARGKIEAWQGNIGKAEQYFKLAELCSQLLLQDLK